MAKKSRRSAPAIGPAAAPAVAGSRAPAATEKWLNPLVKVAEPLSLAVLFAYFLHKTWMRWPDPLIDFPRDLYTAWRVSEGDLLYTSVTSWYGPLSHLIQGAAFKVFGVGLDTMVWLNVAVAAGVVWLVRAIFFDLGGRLAAWLCAVVFIVVFAFGQFVGIGNYNFITPYAAQATYGFAGLVWVLWALLRHLRKDQVRWLAIAGAGLGVAYLSKPEVVLASAGALVVYFAARWLRDARAAAPGGGMKAATLNFLRGSGWVFAGFFAVCVPVFLVLAAQGGVNYAAVYTNWVAFTVFSNKFRSTGLGSQFNKWTLGTDYPAQNRHIQMVASFYLVLPCLALALGGWVWARAKKFGAVWWIALTAVLGLGVFFTARAWQLTWVPAVPPTSPIPATHWAFRWTDAGRGVVFTTFLAAAIAVAWAGWSAYMRRTDFAKVLACALVGAAGALMLVRMILNGRFGHYGFFMAPLATLFLLSLATGILPRALAGAGRGNWPVQIAFTLLVLSGVKALADVSAKFYAMKTYPVGEGRDRFFTYDPKMAPPLLRDMIQVVKSLSRQPATLLALPETAAVNYHLRIPNAIPEMEFQPTTLAFVGIDKTLADLRARPPEVILFYPRDLAEYGIKRHYLESPETGLAILDWIRSDYRAVFPPPGTQLAVFVTPTTPTGHYLDVLVHQPSSTPAPP